LATAGSLRLQPLPNDRGTAVRLNVKFDPPGGKMATALARWLGTDVERDLTEGLRRMKQVLETGEIARSEPQPHGSCDHSILSRRS
jgi:uncharacterized membrane protein